MAIKLFRFLQLRLVPFALSLRFLWARFNAQARIGNFVDTEIDEGQSSS
jgi:hypothetical protein